MSIPEAVYVEHDGLWHRLPIDPAPPHGIENPCGIPEDVVTAHPLTTERPIYQRHDDPRGPAVFHECAK